MSIYVFCNALSCVTNYLFDDSFVDTPLKAFAEHLALEVCREIEASYKRRIDI